MLWFANKFFRSKICFVLLHGLRRFRIIWREYSYFYTRCDEIYLEKIVPRIIRDLQSSSTNICRRDFLCTLSTSRFYKSCFLTVTPCIADFTLVLSEMNKKTSRWSCLILEISPDALIETELQRHQRVCFTIKLCKHYDPWSRICLYPWRSVQPSMNFTRSTTTIYNPGQKSWYTCLFFFFTILPFLLPPPIQCWISALKVVSSLMKTANFQGVQHTFDQDCTYGWVSLALYDKKPELCTRRFQACELGPWNTPIPRSTVLLYSCVWSSTEASYPIFAVLSVPFRIASRTSTAATGMRVPGYKRAG